MYRSGDYSLGLPRWCSGKESTCQCRRLRDAGLIPGSGGSPKEGNGNPLQYSYLENSMDRGVWSQTPKGHKESDTQRVGHAHTYTF